MTRQTPGATGLVELATLDTSFAVPPDQEGATRRRLMTLLAEQPGDEAVGRQSEVLRATNTAGEVFALKRLRPLPADVEPYVRKGREASLFEEYRCQFAVSHLQGFPRVLGYSVTRDNEPVILMEWVEGPTLLEVGRALMPTGADRGRAVAALATSLLRSLVATQSLEGTFVHRDISPRNVIVRGDEAHVRANLAEGRAPTCLVDFGSAIYLRPDEATLTVTEDIWRNGTPEYAAPEMLAPHGIASVGARRLPAVDVYALCSVLYELYAGRTPFAVAEHPERNAYDLKANRVPERPEPLAPGDDQLVDAIMSGIRSEQAARPSERELLAVIREWGRAHGLPTDDEPTPMASSLASHAREGAHLHVGEGPLPHARRAEATGAADANPMARQGTAATETLASDGTWRREEAPGTRVHNEPAGAHDAAASAAPNGPHLRRLSRRGFVKAAAGAAALAAIGGAAALTNGFGLLRPRSFGELGWDDLAALAGRITAATSEEQALDVAREANLLAGDGTLRTDLTKALTLTDGAQACVQLVDLYHDDRSDGRGKAGLTFAFAEPLAARTMASAPMASGGWETCELRSWMSSELAGLLPEELASRITTVRKVTNNVGAATGAIGLTETDDALWLFSVAELGGIRDPSTFSAGYRYLADILNGEGTQYRLWSEAGATARSANQSLERSFQGSRCYWWLRSPSPDVSASEGVTWFNRVGTNGDPFHFAGPATGDEHETYALPGFCL